MNMSNNLVEMMKSKVEEAKSAIRNLSPNAKDASTVKQNIEKHIEEMQKLMKDVDGKDEKAAEEFKEKVASAVEALGKLIQK